MDNQTQLLEYLKNDLAHTKIQNELLVRRASQWFALAVSLLLALFLACVVFAGAIVLLSQEHTKQLHEALSVELEVENPEKTVSTITQTGTAESSGSGNATLNQNANKDE